MCRKSWRQTVFKRGRLGLRIYRFRVQGFETSGDSCAVGIGDVCPPPSWTALLSSRTAPRVWGCMVVALPSAGMYR